MYRITLKNLFECVFHQQESKVYKGCGNVCVYVCVWEIKVLITGFPELVKKVRANLVEMGVLK